MKNVYIFIHKIIATGILWAIVVPLLMVVSILSGIFRFIVILGFAPLKIITLVLLETSASKRTKDCIKGTFNTYTRKIFKEW